MATRNKNNFYLDQRTLNKTHSTLVAWDMQLFFFLPRFGLPECRLLVEAAHWHSVIT
jgi:hypothetical protein